MKTVKDLRDNYASIQEKIEAVTDAAKEEKRDFNDEERSRLTAWEEELEALEKEIAFQEKIEARLASKVAANMEQRHKQESQTPEQKAVLRYSLCKAILARAKFQFHKVRLKGEKPAEKPTPRLRFNSTRSD